MHAYYWRLHHHSLLAHAWLDELVIHPSHLHVLSYRSHPSRRTHHSLPWRYHHRRRVVVIAIAYVMVHLHRLLILWLLVLQLLILRLLLILWHLCLLSLSILGLADHVALSLGLGRITSLILIWVHFLF